MSEVSTLQKDSVGVALDLGGAHVAGSLNIDEAQVHTLITDGLHFAANDHITLDVHSDVAAGTHLHNSLKDLQKLGVDAVAVSGTENVFVELGGLSAADLNTGVGIASFDDALNVTVDVKDAGEFKLASELGVQLHDAHIDNVELSVGDTSTKDFAPELNTLLHDAQFMNEVDVLKADHVGVALDLGGAHVDGSVSINEGQAGALIDAGLHFAAADHITVDASHLTAEHTHLNTSLKDLQKLGVDAVSVAAGEHISVTLGGFTASELGAANALGGLHFENADLSTQTGVTHLTDGIHVTLDVANLNELHTVASASVGNHLQQAGIDDVQINLQDSNHAGYSDDINTLLFGAPADIKEVDLLTHLAQSTLSADVKAIEDAGLAVSHTIDVGGTHVDASVNISEVQASGLIADSLHFAAADHITLHATGTYVKAHAGDLQHLGVDAIALSDSTATDIVQGDHSLNIAPAFDVSLDWNGHTLTELQGVADVLSASGIDHVNIDVAQAEAWGLSAIEKLASGQLDFNLEIDNAPSNLNIALTGIGFTLGENQGMGNLIAALSDAGIHAIDVDSTAKDAPVHISDDLSAALYDAGMLHALPDANIAIDAGVNKVLNTTLKAMADLGVDTVHTDHKVFVDLGIAPEHVQTIADMHDLFSAFGLDSSTHTSLFDGSQQAGLVINHTTFESLGTQGVQELVSQVTKLGFTEVDVVGDHASDTVYKVTVTPQDPVHVEVQAIGTANEAGLADVFDHHVDPKTK